KGITGGGTKGTPASANKAVGNAITDAEKQQKLVNKAHTKGIVENRKRDRDKRAAERKSYNDQMSAAEATRRKTKEAQDKYYAENKKAFDKGRLQAEDASKKEKATVQKNRDDRAKAIRKDRYEFRKQRELAYNKNEKMNRKADNKRISTRAAKRDNVFVKGQGFKQAESFAHKKGVNPAAIQEARNKMAELNKQYMSGAISQKKYTAAANGTTKALNKQSRSIKNLNQHFMDLRHSMVGMGILGAGIAGGAGIITTGQGFEAAAAKMLGVTGSLDGASKAMDFARMQSKRLGLDLLQTTDAYARIGIAADGAMTKMQTDDLFVSFSELATSFKLSKVDQQRGLRSLEQMLNKGQLMAEEVKQQFAEAIPGGIKVFSRALGMNTQEFFKAMEAGELMAADVLPLVAKEMAKTARKGGMLDEALKSNRVAMGQMTAEWKELADVIFQNGVGDLMTYLFHSFEDMAVILKVLIPMISNGLADAFKLLTAPITLTLAVVADLLELMGADMSKGLGGVINDWGSLLVTVLATLWGLKKIKDIFLWSKKHLWGRGFGKTAKEATAKKLDKAAGLSKKERKANKAARRAERLAKVSNNPTNPRSFSFSSDPIANAQRSLQLKTLMGVVGTAVKPIGYGMAAGYGLAELERLYTSAFPPQAIKDQMFLNINLEKGLIAEEVEKVGDKRDKLQITAINDNVR
ncbi:tape measure protein, partial [bacterium]|nr:tape measure protein [bacterium]